MNPWLEFLDEDWHTVSKAALIGWLAFYALFLLHAATDDDGFLFIDNANLIVHEAGHLLAAWTENFLFTVWSGTLLQWLVPLALAATFLVRRHTTGFVFCLFVFFENFLYTSVYMADARAMDLPLVTVGGADADTNAHDWNIIFSHLGMLHLDTRIAGAVRAAGWLGMLGTVGWLLWRGLNDLRAART
jgi:hypothetical protein